ncbi:MAG: ribbon-helix-helix domain-containing protein [Fervidicoccaceae archaeon]
MDDTAIFEERSKRPTNIEIIIKTKKIVSFKVSEDMFEWIENAWRSSGFSSRSDYLRALIISLVDEPNRVEKTNGDLLPIKAERTITFKLDNTTLHKLDELTAKKGYSTRSDLLREVIYSLMRRQI